MPVVSAALPRDYLHTGPPPAALGTFQNLRGNFNEIPVEYCKEDADGVAMQELLDEASLMDVLVSQLQDECNFPEDDMTFRHILLPVFQQYFAHFYGCKSGIVTPFFFLPNFALLLALKPLKFFIDEAKQIINASYAVTTAPLRLAVDRAARLIENLSERSLFTLIVLTSFINRMMPISCESQAHVDAIVTAMPRITCSVMVQHDGANVRQDMSFCGREAVEENWKWAVSLPNHCQMMTVMLADNSKLATTILSKGSHEQGLTSSERITRILICGYRFENTDMKCLEHVARVHPPRHRLPLIHPKEDAAHRVDLTWSNAEDKNLMFKVIDEIIKALCAKKAAASTRCHRQNVNHQKALIVENKRLADQKLIDVNRDINEIEQSLDDVTTRLGLLNERTIRIEQWEPAIRNVQNAINDAQDVRARMDAHQKEMIIVKVEVGKLKQEIANFNQRLIALETKK